MAQIYVACLASYNAGVLHGRWIEVDDVDSMEEQIAEMLRESPYPNSTIDCPECAGGAAKDPAGCGTCKGVTYVPTAEEYAVHDYDGLPANHFGEHPSMAELVEYVELVEKHGDAFEAFFDEFDYQGSDLESEFQDRYRGSYESEGHLVDEYISEFLDVPERLENYIDEEKVLRDLQWDLSIIYHGGKYHVFWKN